MIYVAKNNIYLCDLEYLGGEVKVLEDEGKTRTVSVSFLGRTYRLRVKKSPQGWHVTASLDQTLSDLAAFMEDQFDLREHFPYLCFTKIRESKMRVIRIMHVVFFLLSIHWGYRFFTGCGLRFAFMSVISMLIFLISLYLPCEILKRTYKDYMDDVERDGGPGPMDFHDMFN